MQVRSYRFTNPMTILAHSYARLVGHRHTDRQTPTDTVLNSQAACKCESITIVVGDSACGDSDDRAGLGLQEGPLVLCCLPPQRHGHCLLTAPTHCCLRSVKLCGASLTRRGEGTGRGPWEGEGGEVLDEEKSVWEGRWGRGGD